MAASPGLQTGHCRSRPQKIHGHVATPAEGWLKFFQREKDFAVVVAGVVLRLNVDGADKAVVLPRRQVRLCAHMRVIEAKARWLRDERDSSTAVGCNEGRTLFCRTIYVRGEELSVPMQLLRRIGVVVDIDGDLLRFLETEQWTGELTVVCRDGHDAIGGGSMGFVAMVSV